MIKRLYTAFCYFLFFISCLLVVEAVLLNGLGYDRILHIWQSLLGGSVTIETLREHRFRPEVFAFHRWFSVFASVGWLPITWFLLRQKERVTAEWTWLKAFLKQAFSTPIADFKQLKTEEKIILGSVLGVFAGIYAYFAATLPIYYDEAWTYMVFTKRGIFVAAFYYPMPNNHVLFSILTCFATLIKIIPTFQIRLVSILAMLLSAWLLWRWLRQQSGNFYLAMSALLVFLSLFAGLHYAVLARGYALQTFFVLLMAYSLQKILTNTTKAYHFLYIVAVIGGFWTIPTFLYPAAALHGLYFAHSFGGFKKWWRNSLLIALGLWFCYFPLVISNGLDALIANDTTKTLSFGAFIASLLPHLEKTLRFLFGIEQTTTSFYAIIFSVICLFCIRFFQKSTPSSTDNTQTPFIPIFNKIGLLLFLSPAFLLLHHVIPFERTWTYLILPLTFAFFIFIEKITQYFANARLIFGASIAIAVLQIVNFTSEYKREHAEDFELPEVLAALPALSQAPATGLPQKEKNMIYTNFWWTQTQLEYAEATEKKAFPNELIKGDTCPPNVRPTLVILMNNDTAAFDYHRFSTDSTYKKLKQGLRVSFFVKK